MTIEPIVLNGATLYHGDNRDVLRQLPDNSICSVVTDPPYALVSIVKRFGKPGSAPAKGNDAYMRASAGFMQCTWDTGEVAFSEEFWAEVLRVLKPGGHVAAFGASRGYHRMACAIEDAGFEIRDSLMWVYGTGFPKSHDVAKGVDKLDAADMRRERQLRFTEWMRSTGISGVTIGEVTGTNMASHYLTDKQQPAVATRDLFELMRPHFRCAVPDWIEEMVNERTVESENFKRREVLDIKEMRDTSEVRLAVTNHAIDYDTHARREVAITAPATDAARQWEGWGTALKPAFEPIVLARKPLSEKTVAANVLRWGTGALNIGACRVAAADGDAPLSWEHGRGMGFHGAEDRGPCKAVPVIAGRWPANVVHDGSDEVVGEFPVTTSGNGDRRSDKHYGIYSPRAFGDKPRVFNGDSGSAARFFYSAKASAKDRNEGLDDFEGNTTSDGRAVAADNAYQRGKTVRKNTHPTVKPTSLMQWLCRLITPPGGTVLDPFMGSGSTGKAAAYEGFKFIGCEREDEYIKIAEARISYATSNPPHVAAAVAAQQPANDNEPQPETQAPNVQTSGEQTDLFGKAA